MMQDLDPEEYGDVVHRPEDGRAKLLAASLAAKAKAGSGSTSRSRPLRSSQEWTPSQSSQSRVKPLAQSEQSQRKTDLIFAKLQQSLGLDISNVTTTSSQEIGNVSTVSSQETGVGVAVGVADVPSTSTSTSTTAPTQVITAEEEVEDIIRPRISLASLLSNTPPPESQSESAPVSSHSPSTHVSPALAERTSASASSPPDPISFVFSLQPLHEGPRYKSGRKRIPTKPINVQHIESKEEVDDFEMPADLVFVSQRSQPRTKTADRGEQMWSTSVRHPAPFPSPSPSHNAPHLSSSSSLSAKRKRALDEFHEADAGFMAFNKHFPMSQSSGKKSRGRSTGKSAAKEVNLSALSAQYRASENARQRQEAAYQQRRRDAALQGRSISQIMTDVVKQEDEQKKKAVVVDVDSISSFPEDKKSKVKPTGRSPLRLSSSSISSTALTSPASQQRSLTTTPITPQRPRAFLQDLNMDQDTSRSSAQSDTHTPTRLNFSQKTPSSQIHPTTPTSSRGRSDWLKNMDTDETLVTQTIATTPTRSAEKAKKKNARGGGGTLGQRLAQVVRDYKSKVKMENFRVTSNTNAGMGLSSDMPTDVQPTRRVLSMSSPGPQLDLSTISSAPSKLTPLVVRILSGHRHPHMYLSMCVLCSPPPAPTSQPIDMSHITLPDEYVKYGIPLAMLCQVVFPIHVADALSIEPNMYIRIFTPFRMLFSAWEQPSSVLAVRTIIDCDVCFKLPHQEGIKHERDEMDIASLRQTYADEMISHDIDAEQRIKRTLDMIQFNQPIKSEMNVMMSPEQTNDTTSINLNPSITPISISNIRSWTDLSHSFIMGIIKRVILRDTQEHAQWHRRPGMTCIYISDTPGICCEIEIPIKLLATWRDVLENGEGKCVQITGLSVIRQGRTAPRKSTALSSFLSSLSCDPLSMITLRVTETSTFALKSDVDALASLQRPLHVDPLRQVLAGKVEHRATLLCRIAHKTQAVDGTTTLYVCDDSLQPMSLMVEDMPLAVQALTTAVITIRLPWHLSILRACFHHRSILLLRDVDVRIEWSDPLDGVTPRLLDVHLTADNYTEIMAYQFAAHTKSQKHHVKLVSVADPFAVIPPVTNTDPTNASVSLSPNFLVPILETRLRVLHDYVAASLDTIYEAANTTPALIYHHGLLHLNGLVLDIIQSTKMESECPRCRIPLPQQALATKTELTYCRHCHNSSFKLSMHQSILLAVKISHRATSIWLLVDGTFADHWLERTLPPSTSCITMQQAIISQRITKDCTFIPIPAGVSRRAGETHCLRVVNEMYDTRTRIIDDTTEGFIEDP